MIVNGKKTGKTAEHDENISDAMSTYFAILRELEIQMEKELRTGCNNFITKKDHDFWKEDVCYDQTLQMKLCVTMFTNNAVGELSKRGVLFGSCMY